MNLSTRRKLIQEVKDYDLNVNRRVADAQKRKILGISEEAEPYTQLNDQDITKMQEITNIFKQLLEKKLLLEKDSDKLKQYSIKCSANDT
jgi:hypothetical protein